MSHFPDELALLALFRVEPIVIDLTEGLDLFYQESSYRFSTPTEDFIVTLFPSMDEVTIQVNQSVTKHLISYLSLKQVTSFEIIQDDRKKSMIRLLLDKEEVRQTIEIDFRPIFRQSLTEHLIR
ncbi:hypothetical protein [Exiguobacterium antarcticum]|uniref:hypothetical protein n=1 Tax=Exiguobacterium antarcticum TaxID=132920 RepID=UPI0004793921|nr:hypothetical protein [Exiguobacterium antarcticum]